MRRSLCCPLFILTVVALVLVGCGDDDADDADTGSTTTASTASSTTEPDVTTTTDPDVTTTTDSATTTSVSEPGAPPEGVNVYWAWSVDTTSAATPEQLGAGGRPDLWRGDAFAPADALDALLAGPDELETEIGMTTQIPEGTTASFEITDDNIAVIDLSSEFNATSGTLGETLAIAQIVFTVTQFDGTDTVATVDGVSFRIDGVDVDAIGSHGFDVSEPLTRDDFNDSVRPLILLESPPPGAELTDEVLIRGESNTFEGTVVYAVTDGDGLIVAEGFTTATAGNGTWGRFEETVTFQPETAGVGAVIVWEESAEDGSQINLVEYPVAIGAAP